MFNQFSCGKANTLLLNFTLLPHDDIGITSIKTASQNSTKE